MVYFGTVYIFLKHSKTHNKRKKTTQDLSKSLVITTKDWIFNWHSEWTYINCSFFYPEVKSTIANTCSNHTTLVLIWSLSSNELEMVDVVRMCQSECFFENYCLFQKPYPSLLQNGLLKFFKLATTKKKGEWKSKVIM